MGWSFCGTGVRLYGLEPEPPDFVILTQWITLIYIPIAPFRRVKCCYLNEGLSEGLMMNRLQWFEAVERLPLSWSSIVSTYLWTAACLLGTIGPIAYLIERTDGRAATMLEMIILLGLTITLGLAPFAVEWRQKQVLEATWPLKKREAVAAAREAQEEAVQTDWQAKHVLSERTFLFSGVVGLVPGVAGAVWWQWSVPLGFAALGGAALAVGAAYLIDRLLVRLLRNPENRP